MAWATKPPATEPVNMATPVTVCPRASTVSRSSLRPAKARASTSQASVAPEKKVNPSPMRIEAMAQPAMGARSFHIAR